MLELEYWRIRTTTLRPTVFGYLAAVDRRVTDGAQHPDPCPGSFASSRTLYCVMIPSAN